MWCDILNKPKQGNLYRLDCSHLVNVPVYYDNEVEQKANHPALLYIKQDNDIEVPPQNQNIPKANLSPRLRSVLESGIEDVRWELTRVPQKKEFWGTARENVSGEIFSLRKKLKRQ